MSETNAPPPATGPDAYITAAAALLAIPLDPAWIGAIGSNLSVLCAAADLVGGFPLPDAAEPAPVYTA
ncbi:DUF4089 domain-containing protein [Methylobacterium sp. BTF04]|uniref:DUF4089 domain-containing protein n=1 Tax=Methylobacterium sp. BTF04 TaxID=2708300 RepID=UPI0013D1B6D3|nr:DUF4089 domain-containing protein [Methylobacterium sp. BTF04]NEU12824.1 DUF4089 domain-containing protein [Methylobacterium sp. BTF04]